MGWEIHSMYNAHLDIKSIFGNSSAMLDYYEYIRALNSPSPKFEPGCSCDTQLVQRLTVKKEG